MGWFWARVREEKQARCPTPSLLESAPSHIAYFPALGQTALAIALRPTSRPGPHTHPHTQKLFLCWFSYKESRTLFHTPITISYLIQTHWPYHPPRGPKRKPPPPFTGNPLFIGEFFLPVIAYRWELFIDGCQKKGHKNLFGAFSTIVFSLFSLSEVTYRWGSRIGGRLVRNVQRVADTCCLYRVVYMEGFI